MRTVNECAVALAGCAADFDQLAMRLPPESMDTVTVMRAASQLRFISTAVDEAIFDNEWGCAWLDAGRLTLRGMMQRTGVYV